MTSEPMHTYCIWTKTGHRPRRFHAKLSVANAEAKRLAAANPGKKFIVMRMLRKFGSEQVIA